MLALLAALAAGCGGGEDKGPPQETEPPCGEAAWAGLDLASEVVFADPEGGGEGSLGEALALAVAEGTEQIAVLPGTYSEALALTAEHDGLHIAGRCPGEVIVDGANLAEDEEPLLTVALDEDQEAWLSTITLTNGPAGAVRVQGGALSAERLDVRENTGIAVHVTGADAEASLDLADSTISATAAGRGGSGAGLLVEFGGSARVHAVDIDGSPNFGVAARDRGTAIALEEVTVSGAYYSGEYSIAVGIFVNAADATIGDSLVEGTEGIGLMVGPGDTTAVAMRESMITGGFPGPYDPTSPAILVWDGARFADQGSAIVRNTGAALFVSSPGSYAYLRGTTLSDNQQLNLDERPDNEEDVFLSGAGIGAVDGSFVEADGVVIERNVCNGVLADGAIVKLTDSLVSRTARGACPATNTKTEEETYAEAAGIKLENGAYLRMTGGEVTNNAYYGIALQNAAAELSGALIQGTVEGEEGGAAGLWIFGASVATVTDSTIRANVNSNIIAAKGAHLELIRSDVEDAAPFYLTEESLPTAYGLLVSGAATATVQGCEISGNFPLEISVRAGSELELEDTELTSPGLLVGPISVGLLADHGSSVTARDVTIEGYYNLGVLIEAALADDPETPDYDESATEASFSDSAFRSIGLENPDRNGTGLVASGPARVDMERVTIGQIGGAGLTVYDGAIVTGWEVVVEEALLFGALIGIQGTESGEVDPEVPRSFVEFTDSTFKDIGLDPAAAYSAGLLVFGAVDVALSGVSIEETQGTGLWAAYGSAFTLADVRIEGTKAAPPSYAGAGMQIGEGVVVVASELTITGTDGPGLMMTGDCDQDVACEGGAGASMSCVDCSFTDNRLAGAAVILGSLALEGAELSGNAAHADVHGGAGLVAWSLGPSPTAVSLRGGAVADNALSGLYLVGPGSYDIEGVDFLPGEPPRSGPAPAGQAVLAHSGVGRWDEATGLGLRLAGNFFAAGDAETVLLSAATATLTGNDWSEGTSLIQQACFEGLLPPEGLGEVPAYSLCPLYGDYVETSEFAFVLDVDVPTFYLPEPM